MKKAIHVFWKCVDVMETYFPAVLLLIISLEIFAQIIFRIVNIPVGWTEETARYILILATYSVCSKALKTRTHMSVGILPILLPPRGKIILHILSDSLCCVFFCIIIYQGYFVILRQAALHQLATALPIPMVYCYVAPVLGGVLMMVRGLQLIYNGVRELIFYGKEADGAHE